MLERLEQTGCLAALRTVMIIDRIYDRAKQAELIIFDGTVKDDPGLREKNVPGHLAKAYALGYGIADL